MSVAAITITYNRLDLTKRTLDSFYSKTGVDYHLFIDNGSTDGTQDYLKSLDVVNGGVIFLDQNYGITQAFCKAVDELEGYDYILKLDNDVETVTDDIIAKMVYFLDRQKKYAVSPVDLNLQPNFKPVTLNKFMVEGYRVEIASHTGGAFQLASSEVVKELCREYRSFKKGDYMIGHWYRRHGINPAYLLDLEMRHIGLGQSTSTQNYIL